MAKQDTMVYKMLRGAFPHGHPDFIIRCIQEAKLHSQKNHDYAAGGDPLGNFRRVANILAQYPGLSLADPAVVAAVFMLKQYDAYLWLKSSGHAAAVEGIEERIMDVGIYAKIIAILDKEGQ